MRGRRETRRAPLLFLLAGLAIDQFFDVTVISGVDGVEKPEPAIFQIALERAEVGPEAAVFVGDTIWDVQACKKAGLACIAVLTGGTGRDELREAGAAEIYDGPAELLTALPGSLIAG